MCYNSTQEVGMNYEIAKGLLDIGAVELNVEKPFVWASGVKSPIYSDNRLILTSPDLRIAVENAIAETVKREYPDCECLMGTATAGIAYAAIVGHMLALPMGYVRIGATGKGRQVEGKLESGQKVVVIEDLISTAKSVLESVAQLRQTGADVLGMVSILNYGMKKGADAMENASVKNVSLCSLDDVVTVAVQTGRITEEQKAQILAFRENPFDDKWQNI